MEPKGKKRISLKLTPDQQKQVKQAIGKNAQAIELTGEDLEERIAPSTLNWSGSGEEQPKE
jgi:hypothetical protein